MKIIEPSNVNHPSHYNQYDVEVLDMMECIWGSEAVAIFCKLNAFKYRMRAGHKNNLEEDLKKEAFYLKLYDEYNHPEIEQGKIYRK